MGELQRGLGRLGREVFRRVPLPGELGDARAHPPAARQVLDLETAKQYCCGEAASARIKGDFVILEFLSEDEGGDWDDGSGWLSSLIPLRADIAGGDHRALYLAWLLCVQAREVKDDATGPPISAGLDGLTAPLKAFADFLRIDADLITVAAARSPRAGASTADREIERWIAALPEAMKTEWLVRFAGGREPHLRAELVRRFRASRPALPVRGARSTRSSPPSAPADTMMP